MPAKTTWLEIEIHVSPLLAYYFNSCNVNYMAELSRNKIGRNGFQVYTCNQRNRNFHIYTLNNLNFWPGFNAIKEIKKDKKQK